MNYSANDLMKMQEDAVLRVREMQNRANKATNSKEQKPIFVNEEEKDPKKSITPQIINSKDELSSLKQLFKGEFKINSDMLIIGAVAYLLYKQKADIKIILALGYILL